MSRLLGRLSYQDNSASKTSKDLSLLQIQELSTREAIYKKLIDPKGRISTIKEENEDESDDTNSDGL